MYTYSRKYNLLRRVYAWIGFITLLVGIPAFISFLIWANLFINSNI